VNKGACKLNLWAQTTSWLSYEPYISMAQNHLTWTTININQHKKQYATQQALFSFSHSKLLLHELNFLVCNEEQILKFRNFKFSDLKFSILIFRKRPVVNFTKICIWMNVKGTVVISALKWYRYLNIVYYLHKQSNLS
jgi:hypothetical protein